MILKEVKHNKIQRSQHKIIKLNIIKTNKSIIIRMKFYQKMLRLPEFKLFIILIKEVNHNNLQGPLSNLNKIKIIK